MDDDDVRTLNDVRYIPKLIKKNWFP